MAKIYGHWMWRKDYSIGPWLDDQDERKWSCHLTSNNQEFVGIETSILDGIQEIGYSEEGILLPTKVRLSNLSTETGQSSIGWDNDYLIMNFGTTEQEIDDELYSFISEHAYYLGTSSDLLVEIAENEQKVYDAGYRAAMKIGGNDEWYAKGKQAEYDAFWNMIQDHGNRTDYGQAFRNWRSSTEYLRPKYKVVPTASTSAMNTFYNCEGLKKIEAEYFDFSKKARGGYQGSGWYNTFTACGELEEIEDIGIMPDADMTNTFQYCGKLKKVAKITVDVNTVISTTIFGSCPALESVTFDGEIGYGMNLKWSTKLTRATIESIINHLSDTASGKPLTLSTTAVNNAFPDPSNNEDWGALIMAHQNWSISLV